MLARTKDIGAGGFRARRRRTVPVARHPRRWDGLGRIGGRRAPRPSIKVRQQLPGRARYVVVVGRQEPAVRAPRAGLDTVPRPSVHMALAAGRAPHRHNAIPAAGDADRDHIGDAVEGAQRGQGDSRCRAAAVRCRSNVPASSIASVTARCRRSSRASSAPCSLNNTTNGPNHAATSASTSSANPAATNTHHQNRRPTRRH